MASSEKKDLGVMIYTCETGDCRVAHNVMCHNCSFHCSHDMCAKCSERLANGVLPKACIYKQELKFMRDLLEGKTEFTRKQMISILCAALSDNTFKAHAEEVDEETYQDTEEGCPHEYIYPYTVIGSFTLFIEHLELTGCQDDDPIVIYVVPMR